MATARWRSPCECLERVQLGRTRAGEETVPGVRSHARHDSQSSVERTECDRAGEPGQIGEQVGDDRLAAVVDRQDENDGAGRERREHGLGHRLLDNGFGVL